MYKRQSSFQAIEAPIREEGEAIDAEALQRIFDATQGYPYYLQEWGKQVWDIAEVSPMSVEDVEQATERAIAGLDAGFFRVRLDRLSPKEQEYVYAMAELGKPPYRSKDIAEKLGCEITKLGPARANIIHKGMAYSPSHGDIAFTVPMFEGFLNRERERNKSIL